MSSENIKGIQQRLHELNTEESRLLADVQVSLAGIERIHAQRRMEELTLVELQSKAENDRREREDKKPRTKQEKQGKQGKQGQARNEKRGAEEQLRGAEPSKRQRRRGLKNAYGAIPIYMSTGELVTMCLQVGRVSRVYLCRPQAHPTTATDIKDRTQAHLTTATSIKDRTNHYRTENASACPAVNIHCGGSGMCAVCKALGCGGIAQSHYRDRKKNNEDHGNVPGLASSAAATWPNNAASVINIDVMDSQG
ncbi:hypothetical protein JOM56_004427 [Amanita muscaria]